MTTNRTKNAMNNFSDWSDMEAAAKQMAGNWRSSGVALSGSTSPVRR